MTRSVFIVAAERSGDSLGEGLVRELRKLDPDLEIHGIGGTAMAGAG
ncbi:MAG: lipid-A-disaccharide synthase, partial [Hyphomonadaceae bacterium]|nr:lipid-A-disaccharide synthase [Hyphomonadaceae bacterium]